ncbi:Aluminum-activated malate transporter [Macleaya cordata]|uniref:Aluminum-activated malate transporter n=1 Tax=Macleaya cordata TaxID=56857 RepID=A0A200Q9M2_MACCD|nr:Aluminum-activated malate transporter [Macleaya cordata]
MDIESGSREQQQQQSTAGIFKCGWSCIKSLPGKFNDNVIEFTNKVKKLGKDDPRRITHSIKVGLTLSLVSLLYYFSPIYGGFGSSTMWAILTVVVVFEFSVGATLGKGLNRAIATFLAGALGVGAHHLATLAGDKGEPILLGLFVFLLASASSFSRFFPGIKARYDYGVLIFILTFSLVSVSGYRVEKILELAHQRLSTIIIGSATCVIISIFVCPVWAGEDLHKLTALNIEKLADFLQGFGGEYFEREGDMKDKKSSLHGYKSVLNSKTSEESLANFARWEPPHGRFRFRHPWTQYLKIGALTRQCACRIEALNGCINSEIQAPSHEFKKKIQEACTKMSLESSKALMELSSSIKTMTNPWAVDAHLSNSKAAADDLKNALKTSKLAKTDLLQIIPAATVTSLLVEILTCIEKIADSVNELSRLAKFKNVDPPMTPERQPEHLVQQGISTEPNSDCSVPNVVITIREIIFATPTTGNGNSPEAKT